MVSTAEKNSEAHRRLLAVGLLLLALSSIWDMSGFDLPLMSWLGSSGGFAYKDSWWLKTVMHEGMQQLSRVCLALVWFNVFKPLPGQHAWLRSERLAVALVITLTAIAINLLKQNSLTSCPWDLAQFGGSAHYISHWAWGVADGGPGRCFPGGHASAGFSFMALAIPGLCANEIQARRRAWKLLALTFCVGQWLGLVQVLRGAHYPSHALWTATICWLVSISLWLIAQQIQLARRQG